VHEAEEEDISNRMPVTTRYDVVSVVVQRAKSTVRTA
jgi:hypothetical protein